jgi:23S rRNA pseudouridine1911/1915/1917 synthase
MTNTFSFAITPEEAGERLDRLLSRGGRMSLRAARRLIGRGAVKVSGVERAMAYRPRAGEMVCAEAGGDAASNGVEGGGASPEGAPGGSAGSQAHPDGQHAGFPGVRVIAEQGGFVAFFKPCGLHTVFLAGGGKPCLEAMLGELCPGRRIILVNRLDKETSGIVIGALGDGEAARFRTLEDEGKVGKRYLALVEDEVAEPLTLAWRLDTDNRVKTRVLPGASPDPLRFTHVTPIARVGGVTLVEARIAKGARHQIRAHLAGAGHAIVGDALYGGPRAKGLRLHHWRVSWPGFCASAGPDWPEGQVEVEQFMGGNPCEDS